MFFKVFTNAKTGKELFYYSLYGECEDEEYYTKRNLAYEHGIGEEDISVKLERRAGVPCETVIKSKGTANEVTYYVYMDGAYYNMACENTRYAGHYEEWEFKGDEDAINTAAKHEATLAKEEWQDGKRVSYVVLYDPKQEAKKHGGQNA